MPPNFKLLLFLALLSAPSLGWAQSAPTLEPTPAIAQPAPEFHSIHGVLTATLEARPQKVSLGGATFDGLVYNGAYAGPTLRVRPGDLMRIKLVNHLTEPTNLHFHGYRGSPLAPGDDAHQIVAPGASFNYVLRIPKTQSPGLYWYHAHMHTMAERQIMSGLSGMMVVEGMEGESPALKDVKHEVFGLKDYAFDDSDDPLIDQYFHRDIETINGGLSAEITLRPGQTGLWGFANEGADLPLRITLVGHHFRVIARDGETTLSETVTDTLVIPPAGRVEALVDAGAAGTYELRSNRLTGSGDQMSRTRVIGVLTVAGELDTPIPTLTRFPHPIDLRTKTVNAQRTISFTEKPAEDHYYINGQLFDHHRIDTRVPLGNIEEWTIRNDSDDYHAFHIHQIGFQVVEINGVAQPFDGYLDTVAIPERGEVKILMPFTDPIILGQFMYHCHVLEHEDKGMMANIEVYDPNPPKPSGAGAVLTDQFGHSVRESDLRGKPTLIFFGYTYCPDVCPTTLAQFSQWLKALGPKADRLNVVYVTVDPQRDTVAQLHDYLSAFDPRIRGLTGTPAQIAKIAKEYGVYYKKAPLGGGAYGVDHSTETYVLDAQGKQLGVINYGEAQDSVLPKLRRLIGG